MAEKKAGEGDAEGGAGRLRKANSAYRRQGRAKARQEGRAPPSHRLQGRFAPPAAGPCSPCSRCALRVAPRAHLDPSPTRLRQGACPKHASGRLKRRQRRQ
jgi:hypothetical protein